jgi:predicted PurR-regulated permease PerM
MKSFRTLGAFAIVLVFLTAMAVPVSADQFSNLVDSGSSMNVNTGSLSSSLGATVTGQPNINYNVGLQGIGNTPAQGSISAYAHGNLMEGRNNGGLAQQILFSQKTTASGEISLFQFSFSYLSKLNS